MKRLLRHPAVQALLARLLGRYLHFALRTTRWTIDSPVTFARLAEGRPTVVAFWHEHLPLVCAMSLLARRFPGYRQTPIHALVSHHRDGRFIGQVIRRFDMDTILGSSSRGGAGALRNLLASLKNGDIIGITPDGPRGPRRQAAPGVAQLAALSGAPVMPVAARTTRQVRLNTWDRMVIPLPFGRGVIVCGAEIAVPRATWRDVEPAIAAALNAVSDRAERHCPA
jgi:lysophospholipid acyltransferase (LPLAT)-like uncharacterized protein